MAEPKKKHYAMLVIASYVVVATTLAIKGDLPTTAIRIGEFLGGGLGVAILPLLAMRFFGNAIGWTAFVLFCMGYTQSQLNWLNDSQSVAPTPVTYRFHPKGCDFSVEFPDKPTIKVFTLPQIGDYEQALWISPVPEDSTALRAECAPFPGLSAQIEGSKAKDFLLGQLKTFAESNGLSSVDYHYSLSDAGPTGTARGIKHIQGIPVTYKIVAIAGTSSLLTLYAGGKSETFPQREVSPFLASVKKVQ